MKAQERDAGPKPTKLKATLCADLMVKLCSSTGRYARVMQPILWELLNCIFLDFPTQEEHLRNSSSGNSGSGGSGGGINNNSNYTGDSSLRGLYSLTTFFDKYKAQLEIYDDVSIRVHFRNIQPLS